jgi:aspartate kinase
MKKYIVQKFGGTSVGSVERLFSLRRIVESFSINFNPIVVVSAVSGSTKNQGTTSLLIESADLACSGQDFEFKLESIRSQHLRLVDLLIDSEKDKFKIQLDEQLNVLRTFLIALNTIGEKSSRSIDFILSFGERLSALLVSSVLVCDSINVRMVDLSNIIDDKNFQTDDLNYDEISNLIVNKISPKENEIIVATGFFGYLKEGILNKVGRGYSDLTAALIARGLGASNVEELQIWKEVDGVYSADPRKVRSAKVLNEISAIEAVELTFFGSEVIHPHTMEQVISKNIPIRVLNSLKPEAQGTIIRKDTLSKSLHPTAVTVKKGIVVFSVTSNRMYEANGFLAQLFEILRIGGLVVDLVSTSEVTVSCTVTDIEKLKKVLPRLSLLGEIKILENRAILAVVGSCLSSQSNSIGKMFSILAKEKIIPEMITQAESRTSISCVLREEEVEKALDVVHNAIFD